jgi:gamma-glutamylcyclotransferase (GGCT)/AIG2-like uncharacterized protein YtfP
MTEFSEYPGPRPHAPTLVWHGAEWDLDPLTFEVPVSAEDAAVLAEPSQRRWVLAYGANASPERVIDKDLDERGAILLPAVLDGWRAVWEARALRRSPLTLVPAAGERLHTWVLGFHHDDRGTLDDSEGRRKGVYRLGEVGEVAVAARWRLPAGLAYGPGDDTHVIVSGGEQLTSPRHTQTQADGILEQRGETTGVPPLAWPVEGWPPTPLEDLDLFVYGTLQPGEARWEQIAELVQTVGAASTPGEVVATPHGFPAATFYETQTPVHGTQLRAHDTDAAAELYRRADAIEDEGTLFRRISVSVNGPEGPKWAAAYTWNVDEKGPPPGDPVPR